MVKERSEDAVAVQLQEQGYLVIRTYRKGCPDLIAFKPEIASQIVAREVKVRGQWTTPEQRGVISRLRDKGVDAQVVFIGESKTPRDKLTKEQIKADADYWFGLGWAAFFNGKQSDCWPRKTAQDKSTNARQRGDWKFGWYKASQKAIERAKQ